jgi:hypothetical protein
MIASRSAGSKARKSSLIRNCKSRKRELTLFDFYCQGAVGGLMRVDGITGHAANGQNQFLVFLYKAAIYTDNPERTPLPSSSRGGKEADHTATPIFAALYSIGMTEIT